jgi:hypothetical protein
MASALTSSLQNSQTNLNQVLLTGLQNPPRVNASTAALSAGSSAGLNLTSTQVNPSARNASIAKSQSYKGIAGLRQAQNDQSGFSALQPAAGWRYKPSSGIVPEINQGAFGTAAGPLDTTADPMPGGTTWFWDLSKAEKKISTDICSSAKKCSQLRLLGEFQDVCGYCKSTGATIPIQRMASGSVKARYNDDSLGCRSADILTSGNCGAEGSEGFVDASIMDNCDSPLTRDCVINAARLAGCRDEGTLIASLKASTGGSYDSVASKKPAYAAYQTTAIPLTNAMLRDGSVSKTTALDDFGKLMKNTSAGSNTKIGAAARDLCLKAGDFDAYNFCSELTSSTVITAQNISCLQEDWKNEEGTEVGTGYPNLTTWNGKTYQKYIEYTNDLFNRLKSTNKTVNAAAVLEFVGTQSAAPPLKNDFPRSDNTRGAETVWIHLGEVSAGTVPPTILRCDLKLKSSKNGEVLPFFTNRDDLPTKYGMPADNIGFTSAFEFRPDSAKTIRLNVASDDGFMVGINQNPFEGTGNKGNDWGSWRFQGASWFQSGNISLNAESSKRSNTVIIKFFEGYGGVYFWFKWAQTWKQWVQVNGGWSWSPWTGWRWGTGAPRWEIQDVVGAWQDPNASATDGADLYLTQEPLAPWLNYEVCTRPNNGVTAMGLNERRWNGPSAISYGGKQIPSFDVTVNSLAITAPTNAARGFAYFVSTSNWKMQARLGFNAIRTLTLLINPKANVAPGSSVNILYWFQGKGVTLSMKNDGNNYVLETFTPSKGIVRSPIAPNQLNYIVLQVVGDQRGVMDFNVTSTSADTLSGMSAAAASARASFVNILTAKQNVLGTYITGSAAVNVNESAPLRIGSILSAQNPDISSQKQMYGFEGNLVFVHGFREYISTAEMIHADIDNLWMTRWPRGDA